jgi:arginine decarboxylase
MSRVDPRDPLGLRSDAPLLDGYLSYLDSDPAPFHVPGHKANAGLLGAITEGDVAVYGGVDTIDGRHHRLPHAEARAAALWGVDWCRFSVGGSTHGNQALALAAARPGDAVVISRTLHRSALLALVLVGLRPIWVRPEVDPRVGLPVGVSADSIERALKDNPDARAVFVTEPSYVGTSAVLAEHARIAHDRGIPFIVDQAWGAHYGFHPDVPPHALSQGADAMVTSAHKALPAYSQAALVLARTERLDPDRLQRGFDATNTTSPAGTIAGSIDAVRALLEREGRSRLDAVIGLAAGIREHLRPLDGLTVVDGGFLPGVNVDPTKVVLALSGTGADGLAVQEDLLAGGIEVELADRDTIVATVTMGDTEETADRFVRSFAASLGRRRGAARTVRPLIAWTIDALVVMRPRDAFFAEHESVSADRAVGRVSAELICPYPPGIPVLAPGELVTSEAMEGLREARAMGTNIRYAADPSLETVQVVVSS